jgi:Mce-associated membrane protein
VTSEKDAVVVDEESTAQELTDSSGGEDSTALVEGEDSGTAADGEDSDTAASDEDSAIAGDQSGGRLPRWLVPVLMAVLLVASAGFAAWVYFAQYRPDQQTDAAVSSTVVKAASDGAVAMLSYAPQTMDKDFATAKSHLTGDFLNYYTKFTNDVVTRAVKEKSVKTQATVAKAAVSDLHPDSALVLAFINQTTVSKENPDGSFAQSAVKITMTKVDGNWLISAFDPV